MRRLRKKIKEPVNKQEKKYTQNESIIKEKDLPATEKFKKKKSQNKPELTLHQNREVNFFFFQYRINISCITAC